MNTKVQAIHLARRALIYVRQSTFVQIQKNRESTLRQYDLAARAQELGWRQDEVTVIDEDQGHSGATTQGRPGFGRLMSEVALGHVGIVLAIEASRLARNLHCRWSPARSDGGREPPGRLGERGPCVRVTVLPETCQGEAVGRGWGVRASCPSTKEVRLEGFHPLEPRCGAAPIQDEHHRGAVR